MQSKGSHTRHERGPKSRPSPRLDRVPGDLLSLFVLFFFFNKTSVILSLEQVLRF